MGVTRTHDLIEEIRDLLQQLEQIADEVVLRARSGVSVPSPAAPTENESTEPTADEQLNEVQPDAAPSSPIPMADILEPQEAEGRDTPTRNFPTISESAPVETTAETPSQPKGE